MTAKKNEAFPEPTKAEIIEARAEGVKDAIRESTKEAKMAGVDEGYGGDDTGKHRIEVDHGVFQLQHLLDLSADALKAELAGKGDYPAAISEGKVAGLLEMERSGKNRTEHVQAMCKHLGIKSPYEVTDAGPAFTNDTSGTAL
jgi:hypothetical protein